MQSGLKSNNRLMKFNQMSFEKHINFAKNFLHSGDMEQSWNSFHDALTVNFESIEAKSGMKIAGFWKERQVKLSKIEDFFDRGEFLLREFNYFIKKYVGKHSINFEHGVNSIEHWIFYTSYNCFKKYGEFTNNEKNPDILLKQGYCLKKMGDYDKAQELLEEAVGICKNNSSILSQLADVYSLINEDKHSKLFFREAFFIGPQNVDLDSLESILIGKIVSEIKNKNYSLKELKEWIPVYGTTLGLFSIKKELKPIEVGILKQSIYSLNNQIVMGGIDKSLITPKLLNHYFRLLEHLVSVNGEKEIIDEVLLNIKLLDETIYNLYLN